MPDPRSHTGMADARSLTGWILIGICGSMSIVVAIWFIQDPTGFFGNRLGFNSQALQIPWAWTLALAVAAGYSFFTLRAVPFVGEHKFELSRLKLLGIWAAIVSGIVEEIVFRQKLMDLAATWGIHTVWQVLLSAAVFGFAHGIWLLLSGEIKTVVPVIAATTILGGLLAIVYVIAGRNVLPAIAAHTVINLVIEPWLILSAVSGHMGGRRLADLQDSSPR